MSADDELTPMQQIALELLDASETEYMVIHRTVAHQLMQVRLTPLGAFCAEVLSEAP